MIKELNISKFKPPFIWNFPIAKLKELQKKANNNVEINTNKVDFKQIYKDGRVDIFLKKFEDLFNKNMKYCQEKMNNNWEYMLSKQFEVFDIKYQPFINKFVRKIDLKPREEKEDEEKPPEEEKNPENEENVNDINNEKKSDYNEEVINTEIDLEH